MPDNKVTKAESNLNRIAQALQLAAKVYGEALRLYLNAFADNMKPGVEPAKEEMAEIRAGFFGEWKDFIDFAAIEAEVLRDYPQLIGESGVTEVVVTTTEDGEAVAVTKQDTEGRIVRTIWQKGPDTEELVKRKARRLSDFDYAVAFFNPEEMRGVDPMELRDHLISSGNQYIDIYGDKESQEEDDDESGK
jgi:hypothetical protein